MRGVAGIALVAACALHADGAYAQNYPSKPIRYLVPDSAGGGNDTIGRIFAEGLTEVFGQQVVVENRAGAGTTIGLAIGAKATPDGYTIVHNGSGLAAVSSLYRNLPFDVLRDFAPISLLATSPQIIVAHPSLPVKSLAELVKLAKARPARSTTARRARAARHSSPPSCSRSAPASISRTYPTAAAARR